ncbi:MAG: hypothetical protein AAGJ31_12920, partial [Verrucomicrobiota bacterium]
WLSDLTEALIGFRINGAGQFEWFDDSPDRVREVAQQISRRSVTKEYEDWVDWLLSHRLSVVAG